MVMHWRAILSARGDVASCEDSDGQLWFGDSAGLLIHDGQTFRRLDPAPELPHSKMVFAVYQRSAGDLLCSHDK